MLTLPHLGEEQCVEMSEREDKRKKQPKCQMDTSLQRCK
jgi:hypothetical protein